MTRYRLRDIKTFSMRFYIDVICIKEGFVFAMNRSAYKDIKDKAITMPEKQFLKEYIECTGPWGRHL